MYIKRNHDVVKEVQLADFRGWTVEQRKPLYIRQNTFDIDVDASIYRVLDLKNLINDLQLNQLTLVKATPSSWGDPLENPLLNFEFTDEEGDKFTLNGLMEKYWALSWTYEGKDKLWQWENFSREKEAVRIKTTIRNLLDRIMFIENEFYMLNYHIGKVEYHSEKEIKDWLSKSHYTAFLDSLGQSTALSLMALKSELSGENEIRLVYSHTPRGQNQWVDNNVTIEGKLCRHLFRWNDFIEEVLFSPFMSDSECQKAETLLHGLNVNCPMNKSRSAPFL